VGTKGSISEFELGVIRARMVDAARAKARRGELRISILIGYVWHRDMGLVARIMEGLTSGGCKERGVVIDATYLKAHRKARACGSKRGA